MRTKCVIRDGVPVLLADPATVEVDEEYKTDEGVKIIEGGSLYGKLADPSKQLLGRTIDEHKPDAASLVPKGNEVDIVLTKNGEPIIAATLPTIESDKTIISELAYSLRLPRSGKPEGIDDREWERRLDAVRDAAREFDAMEEGDAREFLRGRAADPDVVDYATFVRDVQEQRIDDLIDVLDYDMRQKVAGMLRSRRWVRLQAPKGWTQRVLARLEAEDILTICDRLERRGFDSDAIKKHVIDKIRSDSKRESVIYRYTGEGGDE